MSCAESQGSDDMFWVQGYHVGVRWARATMDRTTMEALSHEVLQMIVNLLDGVSFARLEMAAKSMVLPDSEAVWDAKVKEAARQQGSCVGNFYSHTNNSWTGWQGGWRGRPFFDVWAGIGNGRMLSSANHARPGQPVKTGALDLTIAEGSGVLRSHRATFGLMYSSHACVGRDLRPACKLQVANGQCFGCLAIVCKSCSKSCAEPGCDFRVCLECYDQVDGRLDRSGPVDRHAVFDGRRRPRLWPRLCTSCPPLRDASSRFAPVPADIMDLHCPAHVDLCVNACDTCSTCSCPYIECTDREPVLACDTCGRPRCHSCIAAHGNWAECDDCNLLACSECEAAGRGRHLSHCSGGAYQEVLASHAWAKRRAHMGIAEGSEGGSD